jgi:PAS domain S-box-containing protein
MFNEKNLTKYIIIIPIIGILMTSFILTLYSIQEQEKRYIQEIESTQHNYKENLKNISKSRINNLIKIINQTKQMRLQTYKNEIKLITQFAYNELSEIYEKNKQLDREILLNLIAKKMGNINRTNKQLYFIGTLDGYSVLAPSFPHIQGKHVSAIEPEPLKNIFQDFQKVFSQKNEGFYEYTWFNQGSSKPKQKLAYVKVFEPLNLFIGSSKYKDDMTHQIKQEIQTLLNSVRFEDNNYIFAYDYKGVTIAHLDESNIGKNRFDIVIDNRKLIQEIIQIAQQKEGAFLEYTSTMNLQEKKPSKKVSYVNSIDEFQWAIGTGIYLKDLQEQVVKKEALLKNHMRDTIFKTIILSVCITLISLIITLLLTNKVNKIFKNYKRKLKIENEHLEENVKKRTQEQDSLLSLFDHGECILFKWKNTKSWDVSYVSKSVSKIFEYTDEDFIQRRITYKQCIHKKDLRRLKIDTIRAIRENRNIQHQPYRIITKSGKIKWVLEYTLYIKNPEGNITHFLGYIVDITTLKNREKLLSEQSKMASLGEMIGNIAHQWRQPLSSISIAASGVMVKKENDILTDKEFYDNCSSIVTNAQFLSQTIEDFRNFLKDEKIKSLLNIQEIIEKNLVILKGVLEDHNIQIHLDLDENLNIKGYKNELIQALLNIINNAKDVLNEKRDKTERFIFIRTYEENNHAIIEVKDNGGGIKKNVIDKIFEPYYTTKHQSIGTGLGLYMTHQIIVNNSKGKLQVNNVEYHHQNKKYKGVIFKIILPI